MGAQRPPVVASAVTLASGVCEVIIRTRGAEWWSITQVSVEMIDASSATCTLRYNGRLISPLVPNADTAGGDPPIILRSGDEMSIRWEAATPGAVGQVTCWYNLLSEG